MKNTFDQLLAGIWADNGLPDMTDEVKASMIIAMSEIMPEILALADSYVDQELDEDELATQMGQLFDDTFGFTQEHHTKAGAKMYANEYYEGLDDGLHSCWNCGTVLDSKVKCHNCSAELADSEITEE